MLKGMSGNLPNQSAPSVSSCVARNGDDPVTGASLPTCREPSRSALRRRRRSQIPSDACITHRIAVNWLYMFSVTNPDFSRFSFGKVLSKQERRHTQKGRTWKKTEMGRGREGERVTERGIRVMKKRKPRWKQLNAEDRKDWKKDEKEGGKIGRAEERKYMRKKKKGKKWGRKGGRTKGIKGRKKYFRKQMRNDKKKDIF